jgi:hypothetical protein
MLTTKRPNNPINKWENELGRQFAKEEVQKVNMYVKNYSTYLIMKSCKSKHH